jgi:hypothetical protein
MNWAVNDPNGQKAGWVRFGTYAINQVDVDYFAMGGKQASMSALADVSEWRQYE